MDPLVSTDSFQGLGLYDTDKFRCQVNYLNGGNRMPKSQWFSSLTTGPHQYCVILQEYYPSAGRLSNYHHFLLTGRCLSTSKTPEETARHLWSTGLCTGTERDTRQREMSGNLVFGSHMNTVHKGKALNSLGHCYCADLEGVSAHSLQVLMGSGFVIVSKWDWMAFRAFPCFLKPGLSQPAFQSIPQDEMSWLIHSQRGVKHTDLRFSLCLWYFNHFHTTQMSAFTLRMKDILEPITNWISAYYMLSCTLLSPYQAHHKRTFGHL